MALDMFEDMGTITAPPVTMTETEKVARRSMQVVKILNSTPIASSSPPLLPSPILPFHLRRAAVLLPHMSSLLASLTQHLSNSSSVSTTLQHLLTNPTHPLLAFTAGTALATILSTLHHRRKRHREKVRLAVYHIRRLLHTLPASSLARKLDKPKKLLASVAEEVDGLVGMYLDTREGEDVKEGLKRWLLEVERRGDERVERELVKRRRRGGWDRGDKKSGGGGNGDVVTYLEKGEEEERFVEFLKTRVPVVVVSSPDGGPRFSPGFVGDGGGDSDSDSDGDGDSGEESDEESNEESDEESDEDEESNEEGDMHALKRWMQKRDFEEELKEKQQNQKRSQDATLTAPPLHLQPSTPLRRGNTWDPSLSIVFAAPAQCATWNEDKKINSETGTGKNNAQAQDASEKKTSRKRSSAQAETDETAETAGGEVKRLRRSVRVAAKNK